MTQGTPHAHNGNPAQVRPGEAKRLSLIDIVENVFYYRWIFIATFLGVLLLSVLFALSQSPVYTADALIEVAQNHSPLGPLAGPQGAGAGGDAGSVAGEMETVRTRKVLGYAVDKLKQNIQVQWAVTDRIPYIGRLLAHTLPTDGEGLVIPLWEGGGYAWGGERLSFDEFSVPKDFLGKTFILKIGEARRWQLFGPAGNPVLAGQGVSQPLHTPDGAVRLKLRTLSARPGTGFRITVNPPDISIGQLSGALRVTPAKANLFRLSFQDNDPERAATFLNAITEGYLEQSVERRSDEAARTLTFLESELPKMKDELDASEKALNDFRNQKQTLDIDSEISEVLSKASELEKTRVELELRLKELSEVYEPAHPQIKYLRAKLATLKKESAAVELRISQMPKLQQEYLRLTRDADVEKQLYVAMLNSVQQAKVAKAGVVPNVNVIDPAIPPAAPSRPNRPMISAIGGILGLILAVAACQAIALLSGVVTDPRHLEQATGLPTLATLPWALEQVEYRENLDKAGQRGKDVFLLAKEKPNSVAVEALRTLRTSLLFTLSEKSRSKVVLVTSAVPSQGKSFISTNLCYLIGATGKKVLLIEADVRRASIKRYINFDPAGPGLSTVLTQGVPATAVILKGVYPNMDFLPAGPRLENPGELLSSDAMPQLINHLADQYDYVIIDSPPLLAVNDARALAGAADATLFVVRQEMVSFSEMHDAIDVFRLSGNQIDGLVFNGFIPSRLRYGYSYLYGRYRYGKKRYGGYYGNRYGYGSRYARYQPYDSQDPRQR